MKNESIGHIDSENNPDNNSWDTVKEIPFTDSVDPNEVSKLSLANAAAINNKVNAHSVIASDAENNTIKTSNIVVSEKNHISLENGQFLSIDSVSDALNNFISQNSEDSNDVKFIRLEPKREFSDSASAIADIIAAATDKQNTIILENDPKISNQDARSVTISSAQGEKFRSSDLFLGKDRIELPNGEYVPEQSISTALANYIMRVSETKPPILPIPGQPTGEDIPDSSIPEQPTGEDIPDSSIPEQPTGEDTPDSSIPKNPTEEEPTITDQHETVKEVSRNKGKKILITLLPLLLSTVMLLTSSAGKTMATEQPQEIPITPSFAQEQIVENYEEPTVPSNIPEDTIVTIDDINENDIETPPANTVENDIETPPADTIEDEDIHEKIRAGINIGDIYNVPSGVKVHESSDYNYGGANATGQIGGRQLAAGEYVIESFSILDPVSHATSNVTWEEGTNINDYLNQVADKYQVTTEQLEAKLHLGTTNHGAAGWVELNDLEQATIIANQGEQ